MKNTIKLLIKRICIYFASATTFWFIACQPEGLPLKVENKNFSKLMVTRTLSETGTPNDFFIIQIPQDSDASSQLYNT